MFCCCKTKPSCALKAAGTIFLLISLSHLLRIFFKVRVIVADHVVPLRMSIFGFLVTLLLALWMFKAAKSE
jgi:hypothetical protein